MAPDRVAEEFVRVRNLDFLVRRVEPFVAYGGDLPFDVLLVIGFDGVLSPLLDLRFMVRWDREEPVTPTRTREVPVDELVREAIVHHRSIFQEREPGQLFVVSDGARRAQYAAAADSGRYEARRRISDTELRHVVQSY